MMIWIYLQLIINLHLQVVDQITTTSYRLTIGLLNLCYNQLKGTELAVEEDMEVSVVAN